MLGSEWLERSLAEGRWLPEDDFGGERFLDKTFKEQSVALHASWLDEKPGAKQRVVETVVAALGGRVVMCERDRMSFLDFVIVGDRSSKEVKRLVPSDKQLFFTDFLVRTPHTHTTRAQLRCALRC